MEKLSEWIYDNLEPRKTYNPRMTSYGLKHLAERAIGEYVSNERMIQALITAGYKLSRERPNPRPMANLIKR